MAKEIGMNSVQLKKDIEAMEKELVEVRACIDRAYLSVRELDQMWDGPANMAFQTNFKNDKARMNEICDAIAVYINALVSAVGEYEKCEADVDAVILNIRI